MNEVHVSADGVGLPFDPGKVQRFADKVILRTGHQNWDLSIRFCDDKTIRDLNLQYRGKDEATDILSFELGSTFRDDAGDERCLPGDIIISLDTLKENAAYFNVSMDEELRRLLIHGILHLEGHDHESNDPDEPMLKIQESLLTDLGAERIFSPS